MRTKHVAFLSTLTAACALTSAASAEHTLRYSETVTGGVRVIGSTQGHDCGSSVPAPPGTTASCLIGVLSAADSSPDIYWRDNFAGTTVLPLGALAGRTSTTLDLPAGATVVRAQLYWGARDNLLLSSGLSLAHVDSATSVAPEADEVFTVAAGNSEVHYLATADVTDFVSDNGEGVYSVQGIDALEVPLLDQDVMYAGWSMVVVFEDDDGAASYVSILDGLDLVEGATANIHQLALEVPDSPTFSGTLHLHVFEGDFETTGDSVSFDGNVLSNAQNPAMNFFNSSRTANGVAVVGVSPPLTGVPDSMSSYDLDSVSISSFLQQGTSNYPLSVIAGPDTLLIGPIVTETRGCETAADCTDADAPACDPATGSCEICVPGVDEGNCPTETGPICVDPDATGDPFCGCETDSDCGDADSGMVCDTEDTHQCIEGCRGKDGNGCPDGEECTSETDEIGICTTPCEDDRDCPADAPFCDQREGLCVECLEDRHCEDNEICDTDTGTCEEVGGGGAGGGNTGGGDAGGGNNGGGNAGGGNAGGGNTGGNDGDGNGLFVPQGGGLCSCDVVGGHDNDGLFALGTLLGLAAFLRRRK